MRVHPIYIRNHGTGGYARGCRCVKCKTDYREYHKRYRARPGGDQYRADEHLKSKYGITREDLNAMIAAQGKRCAICRKTLAPHGRKGSQTHVDHCHTTGRVRGVLCGPCNQGLGFFYEDPELFERAVQYLKASKS